jgi:acyl-CoA reductase-like NAD-dependent aldehyde dehydrogenase
MRNSMAGDARGAGPRAAAGHAAAPQATLDDEAASAIVEKSRAAQRSWSFVPVRERAALLGRVRGEIAANARSIAGEVRRRPIAETLASEILPLLEAARFVQRSAARCLATHRHARRAAPIWLPGTQVEVAREPYGVVLIIGPSNYPLMLPGIQALQALAAGNAVIVKPGRGGEASLLRLAAALRAVGLPEALFTVTGESACDAQALQRSGVDKVVFTGSHAAGREVLSAAAHALTPATLELSGWDAALVRADADVSLAARALRFGATLNDGATCIAPRRILAARPIAAELEARLAAELEGCRSASLDERAAQLAAETIEEAVAGGARLVCGGRPASGEEGELRPTLLADVTPSMRIARTEVFAPVMLILPVQDDDDAVRVAGTCAYALGATVFSRDRRAARRLAERIDAGVVVLNDAVVPTADPRVPFAGRHASGFGVTRGAEGLLAMTRPKAVVSSIGPKPHLASRPALTEELVEALIDLAHGRGAGGRLRAARHVARLFGGRRGATR